MPDKMVKTSMSLAPDVYANLCIISTRLGVSRSALVSELLSDPLADMCKLFEHVPAAPTVADLVRFRGESMRVVQERIASMDALVDAFAAKDAAE